MARNGKRAGKLFASAASEDVTERQHENAHRPGAPAAEVRRGAPQARPSLANVIATDDHSVPPELVEIEDYD